MRSIRRCCLTLFCCFWPFATAAFDIMALSVQLGPERTIRGPFDDELDNPFVVVRLKSGQFRGFSANGATYAIHGATPTDMSGQRIKVLDKGAKGTAAECGRWINSVIPRADGRLLGFVHVERYCGSSARKSMAMAVSKDEGLTWRMIGRFVVGTERFTPGKVTGEGDCGVVDGDDGYYYAYCLRQTDWRTIVARAPVAKPSPGRWRKWYEGEWSRRGRYGNATPLGDVGTSVARWVEQDAILLLTVDPYFGGVKLSIATGDKTSFVTYPVPIIPLEGNPWIRPAPGALAAYPSMLNPINGTNQVNNTFDLCYVYVPPGADFDQRYLVCREMRLGKK